jgi:hypothetical protein
MNILKSALFCLAFPALFAPVHALTLLRDTVDMRTTATYPETNLFQNPTNDSLILDSVRVRTISIPGNMAQIVFWLREGAEPGYRVNRSIDARYMSTSWLYIDGTPRLAIPPQSTVRIREARFDHCIYCPTAKRSASSAIGDTLKARVIFYSPSGNDSVLFLSIERVSTAIRPARQSVRETEAGRYVDPAGRKTPVKTLQRLKTPKP